MPNLSTSIASLPNLGPGSTGNNVLALQNALVAAGYMTQAQVNTGAGIYGPQTTAAVAKWQADSGINTQGNPGYFGPASKSYVSSSSSQNYSPYTPNYSPYTPGSTPLPPDQYAAQQKAEADKKAAAEAATQRKTKLNGFIKMINDAKASGKTTGQIEALFYTIPADFKTEVSSSTGFTPSVPGAPTGVDTTGTTGAGTEPDTTISPTDTKPDTQTGGTNVPGVSTDTSNVGLSYLSPEAWQTLVPQLQPGTPEYQAAIDSIETSYYDVLMQQMNARTEQEKQVADYNWNTLRDYIQTNLNISLSNDAIQAWDQLQALKNQSALQGVAGTGLEAESIDNYLRKVRRTDAVARTEAQTKEEAANQAYYTGYASSEQIQELIRSNPELAKAWGLVPSDAVRASLTPAALKAKYPNMSDEEIQRNIATILDENGNYRSTLSQKRLYGAKTGVDAGTVSGITDQYGNPISAEVTPGDVGIKDIEAAKERYKSLNAFAQAYRKELEARAEVTPATTSSQYIRPVTQPSSTTTPTPTIPATTGDVAGTPQDTGTLQKTPPTPYTFKKMPNNNIEIYENGKRISTASLSGARSYGYTGD